MAKEITGYVKLQIKGGQANPAHLLPSFGTKRNKYYGICKALRKTKALWENQFQCNHSL